MADDDEQDGDAPAEAEVTELSAGADGSIHASLEIPLGGEAEEEAETPEPGENDEPGPDVIGGVSKVASKVLGTLWDVVKPSEE